MGRKPKSNGIKSPATSYATPQPSGVIKRQNQKITKTDPPPKRKKLAQELDDEISDKEFDVQLGNLRELEKNKNEKKKSSQDYKKHLSTNTDKDESEDEDNTDSDDDEDESEDVDGEEDSDDDDGIEDDDEDDSELSGEDSENEDSDESEEMDEDMDISRNAEELEDDDDDDSDSKSNLKNQSKKAKPDSAKAQKQKSDKDKNAAEIVQIEAVELKKDLLAKVSRDKRSLFLKSLPKSVTIQQIQALSSDIVEVRMHICKDRRGKDLKCAWVEFADEATAVKNKLSLEDKEINNQKISVDFVGEKSVFKPTTPQLSDSHLDAKKLYVSGFGNTVSNEDLKKLFPSSSSIDLPFYRKEKCPKGLAFIHFADEKKCKEAHASMQNQSLNGNLLTVMYAKLGKARKPQKKKNKKEKKLPESTIKTEKDSTVKTEKDSMVKTEKDSTKENEKVNPSKKKHKKTKI